MLHGLLDELRRLGVPVGMREHLDLMALLSSETEPITLILLYELARCSLVKDERLYDRFDAAFKTFFEGAEPLEQAGLPSDWLRAFAEKNLSLELLAKMEADQSLRELWEKFQERLKTQKGRHEGGSKWIGTAGTSPFGAHGAHPSGVRVGQDGSRLGRAAKVWDRREWRDYDDRRELGTRNFKVALRRLRRLVREGVPDEFDLDETIASTAESGGLLDLQFRPERRNRVRVLLLLDVGGSMDRHVRQTEELFSAARSEISDLAVFYFHNCPYEKVWSGHPRHPDVELATVDLLARYDEKYALIVVGDASMSPFELMEAGGSVEHWNEEAGEVWLNRLAARYTKRLWLNPLSQSDWKYTTSIGMVKQTFDAAMHDLSLASLVEGLDLLRR